MMTDAPVVNCAFVKQILSADSIVVRERASNGPPISYKIVLSNITCPKLARRPNPNSPASGGQDESFAWVAREFVRSLLIGKEICYSIENKVSESLLYGSVYLGKNTSSQNLAHLLVAEGYAKVRQIFNPQIIENNSNYQTLIALEKQAQSANKGLWSDSPEGAPRNICWQIENVEEFFERYSGKKLSGIVEFVRDGNAMQVQLLPIEGDPNKIFYTIMISLSGIKSQASKMVENERVHDPFALDAQFFVESRLLQREVTVILESLSYQNFVGSVLHPNGNIALFLLREGLARCLEWNLAVISAEAGRPEDYREAEQTAKAKRLRIWSDYQPSKDTKSETGQKNKKGAMKNEYTGLVVEVGNGDYVLVKCQDSVVRKFFLSSIRPPRINNVGPQDAEAASQPTKERIRPLYDIPYVFEAREFLRKRLIGKQVSILVDYVQPKPADSTLEDRVCATIKVGDMNIAEALLQKGLASVVRYRNPTDARSKVYDSLLAAETQAKNKSLGIFDPKKLPPHRVTDLAGNATRSRDLLPSLQRLGSMDVLVEFIASASRLRVFIIRENCLVTALCCGIMCQRPSRRMPNMPFEAGEPFGDEALSYTRELCMQREVKFEADSLDRVGNFIGWIILPSEVKVSSVSKSSKRKGTFLSSVSLSALLVARGFATVSRAANTQKSVRYTELMKAEAFAMEHQLGLWSSEEFRNSWNPDYQQTRTENEDTVSTDSGLLSVSDLQVALPPNAAELTNSEEAKKAAVSRIENAQLSQVTTIAKPSVNNNGIRFFVHLKSNSTLMHTMNEKLNSGILASASFSPKKGLDCAARFSDDNLWYRARILKVAGKLVSVIYIDFGNEETLDLSIAGAPRLALLPFALADPKPMATEYRLAYLQFPPDSDVRQLALDYLTQYIGDQDILVSVVPGGPTPCGKEDNRPVHSAMVFVPQKSAGSTSSSLEANCIDVGEALLAEGLVFTENVKMPADICIRYFNAQKKAMLERKNIWRYGDFRDEDNV